MQDLVAPCVEQGIKHKEQFVETIEKLHQHESKIVFLEDVLYKAQTVDNRFDAIELRFAKMEERRALDNQALRNELQAHKNEMDRILHEQERRLSKIDLLTQRCDAAEETCRTTEERLLRHTKDTQATINQHAERCVRDITENRRLIRASQEDLANHSRRIVDAERDLADLKSMTTHHAKQIEQAVVDIEAMKNQKAD